MARPGADNKACSPRQRRDMTGTKSRRPGIAPGPSHSFLEWISLEIHSAAASKSAVADFDRFSQAAAS
jgi:hypothetical protein